MVVIQLQYLIVLQLQQQDKILEEQQQLQRVQLEQQVILHPHNQVSVSNYGQPIDRLLHFTGGLNVGSVIKSK